MVPPDRASIRRCRYNGRWSAYLPTSTCAMAPSVGGPPSIKVAGAGAIVLEPMAHNGSPLCLNPRPLGSNQWRRNGRPHQWLALADTIFAGAAGICRAHGDNHAQLRRHDVQPLGAVVTPKACFQHDADLVQSSLSRRRHRRSDRRPSGSNRWRHDGQPRSMATPSDDGDAAAAGTCEAPGLDHLLDPGQVLGQGAAVAPGPGWLAARRVIGAGPIVLLLLDLGHRRLEVFEGQLPRANVSRTIGVPLAFHWPAPRPACRPSCHAPHGSVRPPGARGARRSP